MKKHEKDKAFVWHPFDVLNLEANTFIKKGSGVYLHTSDGRKIIDAISSWWVNLHGHRNKDINKAVAKQLRYLEHVIFAGFTHEPAIKLAEGLIKILPGHMDKIFYSDNGSTAVEVALKMAIQFWHNQGQIKKKFIALEGAYHGDTFGSMSVGARGGFNTPFEPFLFEVEFIDLPTSDNFDRVIQKFHSLVAAGEIAGFIYEPLIQGSAGMRMYDPEHLEALLKMAKEHHVLCIADEVFTGFGRTGKNFASEYCHTFPDIICLSKGLTGGYLPLGATACNETIYNAFSSKDLHKTFLHGHSYTANPLACAAGAESLRILLTEECKSSRNSISQTFQSWQSAFSDFPMVENVRGLGCIFALDVKNATDTSYFNPVREKLYKLFLQKNILLRPLGNVIYVVPPYVIKEKELNYILKTIKEVLVEINLNP